MTSAMEFNLRTDVTQSEMAIYDAKGRKFLTTWDAYDPERWRVLCEPCYYENRYSDWGHYVQCLVCEKQATDGHLASHKHRERVEGQFGAGFREEYRDAIRAGKIPMPTDGLNRRNSFGNVDNLRGEGPHPVDLEFVPTPFRPFDAPAPALAMNGFTTTAGGSSSSSSPQLARGPSSGNAGNTQLALIGEVRNVELRLDENGELPKLTMAEMEKLQPIDCHGRPIPKTHWLWKGDFYEGYLLELFKNPHFYELISLGDWPELRCRLCPRITKCTESHTPGSNEHKKNLRHFCEGQLTMKHQDRAESEALEKATNRTIPKPLKPSEIREGLHLPVGFRHYGQFLAVGDEGLVAENQVEVLCSPAGSSAVSPGTRKGIGKKGMSQRAMLTNTVADALTSSAITNASTSSEQDVGDARLLLQQLRAKFAKREKELQDEVIQLRKQVSDGEKAVRFREELLAVFASREAEKCAELFTLKDLTIITPLMTAALEIKKAEQQEQKKLELQDTITMKKPMENKGGKRPVGGGSSRSGGSSLNTSRLQMNDVAGALGDEVDGDRQLNEAYGNYDGAMDVEEDHNASRAQSVRPYGGFAAQSHSKLLDAEGRGSVSRRQHQVAVEQAQGRNQLSAQRPNGYSAEPPVVNSGKQGACRLPPGLDGLHHERHAPCFYYPHGALEVEDEEHNLQDYPIMNIVQLQPGSKTTYESLPSNTSSSVDPEGDPEAEDHEDRTASCWGVVDAWRDFCNDDGSSKGEGRRKDTNQESHLLPHHGGSISSSSGFGNNLNHNRNSSSSSSNWKDKNGYGYHNYHTDSSSSSWHNYNNQMNQKQPKGLLSQSSAEFID